MELQELHDDLHKKIEEIDQILDAQDDQGAATKRKVVNELIEESKSAWEAAGNQLVTQLKSQDPKVQIGVFYGLLRQLNSEFSKEMSDAVEKMVAEIPKVEVAKVPDEELAKLSEVRSDIYAKIKQLVGMNDSFGGINNARLARKRTGSRGKRGPRAITAFSWTIGEKNYDTLKEVAAEYSTVYEKTGELTKAMREANLDLKEPGDRLEFTLPDGNILIGFKDPEKTPKEDEDDVTGEAEAETAAE